jgi:hypothetical protein
MQPGTWAEVSTGYPKYSKVSGFPPRLPPELIHASFAVRTRNIENKPVINEQGEAHVDVFLPY